MNIEKTIKNFELRGYSVKHFATGAETVEYLASQIKDTTVGIGGCMTAKQIGLYERLCEKNEVFWHWVNHDPDITDKENSAAVYITGANAISEDGEILNIDGTGNRLAGQVYGEKKLYVIASVSKICPDFNSALYRARNVAAVRNCARFTDKTPCAIDGKCHDCRAKERICHALLVLWAPMNGMESEVILIDEELGF